jgi:hypothetical protein
MYAASSQPEPVQANSAVAIDGAGPPAGKGDEDQFPPPSASVGCRFGKPTFAGMRGSRRDAPKPVIRLDRLAGL